MALSVVHGKERHEVAILSNVLYGPLVRLTIYGHLHLNTDVESPTLVKLTTQSVITATELPAAFGKW